ncbi:MAG: aminotransferase class IV [Chitinophagales bacterium]
MRLINYNENLVPAGSAIFGLNRAINYGDGLIENIRIHDGEILFFHDHMERMFHAMKALKIEVPENYTDPYFHKQIIELAHGENLNANARIRICIFRNGGGLYEPVKNNAEFFIEVQPMDYGYAWTNSPCDLGVFRDINKNFSSISFFKSMNALPYVMAAIFRKENNLGDCILLNAQGKIADAISSNLFWIEKGNIFSCPVSDGGIDGIMRRNLIHVLRQNDFVVKEKSIEPEELKNADEIFLTNTGVGIKPVSQFESVIFSSRITEKVFSMLKQQLA